MSRQDKKSAGDKKDSGSTNVDRKKKPAEVLKTSKATNERNPLRADLSEKPAKENKAVRESGEDTEKGK